MDVTIIDQTNRLTDGQLALVEEIINYAANRPEIKLEEDTEMSITFMTNEAIHQINLAHRHKDAPTDVISFALEDEGIDDIIFDFAALGIPRNIGDIMVSVDKTEEQAQTYEHSFDRELGFLVIHGFLHLNGYDHLNEEEEKEMFDLQRKILDDYGLKR